MWAGEREKGNAEELVCPLWRREIHCNMILMVCTGKVYMNKRDLQCSSAFDIVDRGTPGNIIECYIHVTIMNCQLYMYAVSQPFDCYD